MISTQFFYFLVTGGLAAALNWGSRFVFSMFFPFEISIICAFIVGLLTGFILMRVFVFSGAGKPILPQMGKYLMINAFALLQTLIISIFISKLLLLWVSNLDFAEGVGHLFGVLVPVVTSYFGHKYLTFR